MKKVILAILVSMAGYSAQASYLESCIFEAYVQTVTALDVLGQDNDSEKPTFVMVIVVTGAKDKGSHGGEQACAKNISKTYVLSLTEEQYTQVKDTKQVALSYFYVDSMMADGSISSSTRWEIVPSELPETSAGIRTCTVDAKSYAAFAKDGYQVPLADGAKVVVDLRNSKLNAVLIEGENIFKKCHEETVVIENAEMAKNAFQYTGETNFDRFVG